MGFWVFVPLGHRSLPQPGPGVADGEQELDAAGRFELVGELRLASAAPPRRGRRKKRQVKEAAG